jgi:cell division protein FtsW
MLKNKLFLIILGLIILGILTVYSTTTSYCECCYYFDNKLYFFKKHLVYLAIGIVLMSLFSKIDYNILKRFSNWILIFSIILLALTLNFGFSYKGASRWLNFGLFSFRPGDFFKLTIIIFLANFLSKDKLNFRNHLLFFLIFIFTSIILFRQPDIGTFLIISLTFFTILLSSKIGNWKTILSYFIIFISFIVILFNERAYAGKRINVFLNPYQDTRGIGYQTVQSLIAIGSQGLSGAGFNRSIQKWGYLPQAHTDFAFSIFCEELGIIGVLFLFLLYLGFLNCGIKIAEESKDNFAKLLVTGITAQILWQAVINIASATNTIPIIATSLPFISYSGSSIVFTLIGVGILMGAEKLNEK